MYNGILTVCDNCGLPLDGRHKGEIVKKDYIILTGNLAKLVQEPENSTNWVYWLRRKEEVLQMHFCDFKCVEELLETKVFMVKESQRKKTEDNDPMGYGDYRE